MVAPNEALNTSCAQRKFLPFSPLDRRTDEFHLSTMRLLNLWALLVLKFLSSVAGCSAAFHLGEPAAKALVARSNTTVSICSTCTPSLTSCDFYSCLEDQYHCGPNGYPIGYGLKYCEKYTANADKFSTQGQQWIDNVRLCLQQDLLKDANCNSNCTAVNDDAFASHAGCYIQSGLCSLPPTDWIAIEETIGFLTIFETWNAFKEALDAAGACAELIAMGNTLVATGQWQ
ncbi:hypothetical protein BZG36_00725 [Bifiguratus adelaidae]|uniref:Uncharacterized protein n=1 Tax=Bifiguratus adelaidae TaxID=1938954 RepID=A0A261Y6Q9_9FUNG|nr:hypothetical protein BZG36_00725 [Bifiguratus adelaidae]